MQRNVKFQHIRNVSCQHLFWWLGDFFYVFFGGSSFLYASSPVTRIICWQFTFLQTTDTCIILTFLKCLHCYFMTHLTYKEVEVLMELMVMSQWISIFVSVTTLDVLKDIPRWFLAMYQKNCIVHVEVGTCHTSHHVFANKNMYFKPKHDLLLVLTDWYLCLNLTRP